MLTPEQLKRAVLEHLAAENARDVDAVLGTATDDVEYHVFGPHYPDDPHVNAVAAAGREALRDFWERNYALFAGYLAECEDGDIIAVPDRNLAIATIRVTLTPARDFEGLPAGRPFRSYSVAEFRFDAAGKLTRETIYGSLGFVLAGLRRMREFLAEEAARAPTASRRRERG